MQVGETLPFACASAAILPKTDAFACGPAAVETRIDQADGNTYNKAQARRNAFVLHCLSLVFPLSKARAFLRQFVAAYGGTVQWDAYSESSSNVSHAALGAEGGVVEETFVQVSTAFRLHFH